MVVAAALYPTNNLCLSALVVSLWRLPPYAVLCLYYCCYTLAVLPVAPSISSFVHALVPTYASTK